MDHQFRTPGIKEFYIQMWIHKFVLLKNTNSKSFNEIAAKL